MSSDNSSSSTSTSTSTTTSTPTSTSSRTNLSDRLQSLADRATKPIDTGIAHTKMAIDVTKDKVQDLKSEICQTYQTQVKQPVQERASDFRSRWYRTRSEYQQAIIGTSFVAGILTGAPYGKRSVIRNAILFPLAAGCLVAPKATFELVIMARHKLCKATTAVIQDEPCVGTIPPSPQTTETSSSSTASNTSTKPTVRFAKE